MALLYKMQVNTPMHRARRSIGWAALVTRSVVQVQLAAGNMLDVVNHSAPNDKLMLFVAGSCEKTSEDTMVTHYSVGARRPKSYREGVRIAVGTCGHRPIHQLNWTSVGDPPSGGRPGSTRV